MVLRTKQYSAVIQKLTPRIPAVIHHGAEHTSLYCSSKCLELHDGWMLQAHLGCAPVCVCVCKLYIHVHVREREVSCQPGGNRGRGAALLLRFQHKAAGKGRRRGERGDGMKQGGGVGATKERTLGDKRMKR